MNPLPWARILAALAVLAVGVLIGGAAVQRHYEPRLAAANKQIGEFEHAYLTLAQAAKTQNDAITQLHADGERRQAAATAAARRAADDARPHEVAALHILGLKPPPGVDPCRAASAEFDVELARERGRP